MDDEDSGRPRFLYVVRFGDGSYLHHSKRRETGDLAKAFFWRRVADVYQHARYAPGRWERYVRRGAHVVKVHLQTTAAQVVLV